MIWITDRNNFLLLLVIAVDMMCLFLNDNTTWNCGIRCLNLFLWSPENSESMKIAELLATDKTNTMIQCFFQTKSWNWTFLANPAIDMSYRRYMRCHCQTRLTMGTWPCGSAKRKASLWEVNQALVPITSIRQTKARSEVTHWQSTNPRTTPGLSVCFRFGLDMFHYLGCFWCITRCKSLALWQLVKPSKSLWIQNNMMYCHIYVVYVFLFDYLEAWKSTYARSVRLKDNTVGCRLDLRQNYSIVVYWLNWMLYFIVCLIYNHTFTLYTILLKWFIFFQCFIL